ncbi:MAG TPA: hypothetical protein VNO55_05375 [Polyangia bacterium]|nr:hypothetical protein [Polyangia bacterium]
MRRCFLPLAAVCLAACAAPVVVVGTGPDPTATPLVWEEHWFEHNQLLDLVASDDAVALYYDRDIDRAQTTAFLPYVSTLWKYTIATYGPIGAGRLHAIFHKDRYLGCHDATYFDASHDFRNVIDCGLQAYDDHNIFDGIFPHVAAVLVESAAHGRDGAPADPLWHQGKWAELYRYDLYVGTGQQALADAVHAEWTGDGATDPFPAPNTHWFRDWSFPLWRDHGGARVMNAFFVLLARDFPVTGVKYARPLNWGEFVHFMSGAAGADLKPLATTAFGWPDTWQAELEQARREFPRITY